MLQSSRPPYIETSFSSDVHLGFFLPDGLEVYELYWSNYLPNSEGVVGIPQASTTQTIIEGIFVVYRKGTFMLNPIFSILCNFPKSFP